MDATAALGCGSLSVQEDGAGFRITGMLPRGGEAELRAALASRGVPVDAVRLDIAGFEGPFCRVLDLLRIVQGRAAPPPPALSVVGATPLRKGNLLKLDVELPPWPAELTLSYLMSSGEVANLLRLGSQAPGVRLLLGEPRGDFPGWEVDEPFGTDIALVIASDGPLFSTPRPASESLSDYQAALALALRTARQENRRVSARAVVVETRAR